MNCGDPAIEGCLLWTPGPMAYFDKLVGVIYRGLSQSVLYDRLSYPLDIDTTDMRFYGQCQTDSDTYHQLTFDGLAGFKVYPLLMIAKDSTTNYMVVLTDKAFKSAKGNIMIFKITFDPDSAGCSRQVFKTPPRVTVSLVQYFDNNFNAGYFGRYLFSYSKKTNAIYTFTTHKQYAYAANQVDGASFMAISPFKLDDIDELMVLSITKVESVFSSSRYIFFDGV